MEKTRKFVDDIFSSVANKYDLMNDLMSAGLHRLWKRQFIKQIKILPESKIIDMASGTGDIAIKILQKYSDVDIVLCDRNLEMLEIAQSRLINKNLISAKIVCADAEKLPFPDNYFDYYTIAFGIRNVMNIPAVLQESYRILKPGGKFICLEFSHMKNQCLNKIYEMYSNKVIPFIGEKVTKNRAAYEYLVESIKNFPNAEIFKEMISEAQFDNVSYKSLSAGIAAIHQGFKYG